jgi:hypothetical protein
MSNCADRFRELTRPVDIALDDDLAALRRRSERSRIEQYNELKANEETFVRGSFRRDCPEFLTSTERGRIRGNFRLARLLVAASFHSEGGDVPAAMADDFVERELEAVVEFDRYRQFDALSKSQIEERIRRMDGEVYELVEEYISTQLTNLDELLEHPKVQQDLMERLVDRYDDRRERIRQGVSVYIEAYGLEHMVESIEEAVEAVNDASAQREQVSKELREEVEAAIREREGETLLTRQALESELQGLRQELSGGGEADQLRSELGQLQERIEELTAQQDSAETEMAARIERTAELEERLESKIEDLETARERAVADATEEAGQKAAALVENELDQLREQRDQLRTELDRLEREREEIAAARNSLDEKQSELDEQVSQVQQSLESDVMDEEGGIDGSNVVTASMAKVLEMDYLGRFDTSMWETDSIYMGHTSFGVPDSYWEERSERRTNRGYLLDILDDGDPNSYPLNSAARYEITMPGTLGFGSTTEMVIEARVLSNLHAYADNGFDAQPADLDTLLAVVNDVVDEAEEGEYTYLVGLASPTGWSERVRNQIQNDDLSRARYSRHVSICLVNLQDGSLVYDESDEIVRENADLFAPPVDSERFQACLDTIREEYVQDIGTESVLLQDVVDQNGYPAQVVKRAFNRLEQEGIGEQLYLDDLGLSLTVGS